MKKISYRCIICKEAGIKLWRPIKDSSPLLCQSCIEKREISNIRHHYFYQEKDVDISDISKKHFGITIMVPAIPNDSIININTPPEDIYKWWDILPESKKKAR